MPGDGSAHALVVAVDGPSGSGKSTVARGVAARLGLRYLDTGAMYRAATWAVLDAGADPADPDAVVPVVRAARIHVTTAPEPAVVHVGEVDVSGPIRGPEVTAAVSAVSAIPDVRAVMVAKQREIIGTGGIVVEGRDIGTTVAPGADVKVYLTARDDVRALRRSRELAAVVEHTRADLARRDTLDSGRAASPLRRAADAVELDSSDLTPDEVVDRVLELAKAAEGRR